MDFDEVGAFGAYKRELGEQLAALEPPSGLLFGWSVCEHVVRIQQECNGPGPLPTFRALLDEGWQHASGVGDTPEIDVPVLEAEIPTDASGVAIDAYACALGFSLALMKEYLSTQDPAKLAKLGTSAVDLCDFTELQIIEAEEQQALVAALRRGIGSDPDAVRRRAIAHGGRMGRSVRKFEES